MYKDPALSSHLYSAIYSVNNLIYSQNHLIKISEDSFKAILRDLLWVLGHYRKINRLQLNLEDIYLCRESNQDYSIKLDPTNIPSWISSHNPCTYSHNIQTVIDLITFLHSLT